MLITLCYLYLWARWGTTSSALIRRTVRRLYHTRCSFTFRCCSCCSPPPPSFSSSSSSSRFGWPPCCPTLCRPPGEQGLPGGLSEEKVCLRVGGKVFCTDETQCLDDLNKWTLLIVSPFNCLDKLFEVEHITFVTESISVQAGNLQIVPCSTEKIVKWSDYCLPLAFQAGEPYILFAEASIDNFSHLGTAFMEDRLQMDNGMVPHKITSVHLKKSTLEKLELLASTKKEEDPNQVQLGELTQGLPSEIVAKSKVESANYVRRNDQEVQRNKCEQHEQFDQIPEKEMGTGEHHYLHLSSCHECLELENSTIESVKFASAENIPDLPDDYSGSLDDVNCDYLRKHLKRVNLTGKPPNILVYVGSDSPKVNFEEIKSIIMECIDFNTYTVYQLLEKHVLTVPWLDNALLLIIATSEPISDAVSKMFLTFMAKGGKILGLSASFIFGGIQMKNKNDLIGTIQALVFSDDKNIEIKLNVLASGKVFESEISEELSSVKPLGYLNNQDKDMIIVHLPYGDNGGEAILSQAYLEVNIKNLSCQSENHFNLLKISNAERYIVLTRLLTRLGLSCELNEIPQLTPVHLLSSDKIFCEEIEDVLKHQKRKKAFVRKS